MRWDRGSTRAIPSPSRGRSNLSYFDHPPLHQWIVHFAARALGEGEGARLPFVALFAATGWILYRLTFDLFGARAALIAVFALNVTPFFFASAGAWIVPDGPLLFGLAAAVWALERVILRQARRPVFLRRGFSGSQPAQDSALRGFQNTAPRSASPGWLPSSP